MQLSMSVVSIEGRGLRVRRSEVRISTLDIVPLMPTPSIFYLAVYRARVRMVSDSLLFPCIKLHHLPMDSSSSGRSARNTDIETLGRKGTDSKPVLHPLSCRWEFGGIGDYSNDGSSSIRLPTKSIFQIARFCWLLLKVSTQHQGR